MRSLSEIYERCLEAGLTDSQRDFGQMWGGRSESWLSSTLARQNERRVGTEALLGFFMALTDRQIAAKIGGNADRDATISMLRTEVWSELMNRVGR